MSRPQTVFEPYLNPKNSPIWAPDMQKLPGKRSKSIVRIDRTIGKNSCSALWVDPKTVFEN